MAVCAPRSSVFTFESTVHSSHVLQRLDEQRRRDTLCDVTVVVEGQSFRAHRSVLASCSEYFTQRISSLTQQGAVVTLPHEVTVAGFEPLLKFAYTSKLLFGKHDVLDIRNSASVLGFRDLDDACFDFLLPKFLSSNENSAPFHRKTCCKKKCKRGLSKEDIVTNSDDVLLDEKEVKPVADSSFQQEVALFCDKSESGQTGSLSSSGSLPPEETHYLFNQCPKYRKFQLACGKEPCLTEKNVNSPVTVIRDDCDLSCSSPCSRVNCKNQNEADYPGNSSANLSREAEEPWKAESHDIKTETDDGWGEMEVEKDEVKAVNSTSQANFPSAGIGQGSTRLLSHHCPLMTLGNGPAITGSVGHERIFIDITEDKKTRESCGAVHQKTQVQELAEEKRAKDETESRTGTGAAMSGGHIRERSIVVEHPAKRLVCDRLLSHTNFQDFDGGSSSDTGSGKGVQSAPSEWHHLNATNCPFFQDLDRGKCSWKRAELSECEGASQSGVSSVNSGEDGDTETETEGDSEASVRERARQMRLPLSVECIVDLSRNDFQQLLKHQVFTREQLEFVHDMRRRSKNRLAAQRCRKRKLDCISNLQCEIDKLKTEREKLMTERSHLTQMKMKTCLNVSTLCQKVCSEANLQPDQLQVLAKYTSQDCPLSSIFPPIDAILSRQALQHQRQACSPSLEMYAAAEEASSSFRRDTHTGDGQH